MGCSSSLFNNNIDSDDQTLLLNNEIIDKILDSTPKRDKISLEELEKYFKNNPEILSLNIQDKALLVYKWISQNFIFDSQAFMDNFKNKEEINCLALEEIFSEGKGVSHDFSSLFLDIFSAIEPKVETFLIKGYTKNILYKFGTEFKSTNHEWIAIKINHRWKFIDPTFGSGYFTYNDKKLEFIQNYNPFYLFTPPQLFIKTNFPNEEFWQLNSIKMKINKFYQLPVYKSNFFKLGFKSVEPEEGNLIVEKEGKIVINLQKDIDFKNIFINGKMSYKEKDKSKQEENTILIVKKENYFEIFFYINKNIEYKLTLFGINTNNDKDQFREIVVFKINKNDITINNNPDINKDKNNIKTEDKFYPTIFDKFILSDIQLIEPRNYCLLKGERINFKIQTSLYEKNLYFILEDENGDQMIELEKKENNIFEEDSIFIHGKSAKLIYLNENKYMDTLLEYKLIDNPNNTNKVTFPKTYKSIKNKLIEPICDSLKKGEIINFKIEIKNDDLEKIIILDGDNQVKLNQEGNLFFNEVKIKGLESKVDIAYKKKDEDNYKIMYSYKIIN